jgi:long-chain acyl-CoA synthetase
MNCVDYLLDTAPADDRPAVITLSGSHSYGELRRAVSAIAAWLIAAGSERGDRVVLLADNSFFWIAAYLGTIRAGCVAVPLATGTSPSDLQYVVQSTQPRWLFVQQKYRGAFPSSGRTVISDIPSGGATDCIAFEDLLAHSSFAGPFPVLDPSKDLAALMFTSGSTGHPRGVMVSHRNIVSNTASILQYMGLTDSDRVMAILPFYYCFGTSLLHTHLRAGATVVIDLRFMFPDKVLRRMQEAECTGFAGVPSHFQLLLRNSSLNKMTFPHWRWVQQAGGHLAPFFIQQLRDAIPGVRMFVMYGQTEATARLAYLPPELLDRKLGSVGKGIPGVNLRIVDESGGRVPRGDIGEIVAEGDNITLGYWGEPEATACTYRDGRLYTGDLARMDEDGFIYIVDRAGDFLKCAGNRVACKRVEDALLEFDELVEVAVVPIPDDNLGEAVKAYVVPRNGEFDIAERLLRFCSDRWPPHLVPKQIVVLPSLPKNSAGKVMKAALKTEGATVR